MSLKIKKKNPELEPKVAAVGSSATGVVSKEYKSGGSSHSHEHVKDVTSSDLPMASVEFSIGLTRNLGNFESVRIHVGVTMPCPATPDEIDNAYHEAKGWVDARIEQVSAEIDSELKG